MNLREVAAVLVDFDLRIRSSPLTVEVVTTITAMPRVAVSVYVLDDLENWIERRSMSRGSWLT